MAVVTDIKKEVINKISALSTVAKVYGHEKLNPDQFPCVFIIPMNVEDEFVSDAENRRTYAYRVMVAFLLGEDIRGVTEDRMTQAENVLSDVMDQIMNAIDTDYTLSSAPNVLFAEAVDTEFGYIDLEMGWARTCQMTIRIQSDKTIK